MKTQYKVGQKVAVRIRKGSNPYRSLPKGRSNIVEAEIISIGRKYITAKTTVVMPYGNEIKFEFRDSEIYYNRDFELYPDMTSAVEGQKAIEIMSTVIKKMDRLFHFDSVDISYSDIVSINEILNKYISDETVER